MNQNELTQLLHWYKKEAARSAKSLATEADNILHYKAGVVTEFSELLDLYKKEFAYGKPIDLVNRDEEWADAMWYLINHVDTENIDDILFTEDINENTRPILELLLDTTFSYIDAYVNSDDSYTTVITIIHWLVIATTLKVNIKRALEANIEKLRIRYPEKYTDDKAITRDIVEERKSLDENLGPFKEVDLSKLLMIVSFVEIETNDGELISVTNLVRHEENMSDGFMLEIINYYCDICTENDFDEESTQNCIIKFAGKKDVNALYQSANGYSLSVTMQVIDLNK